jgi:hypothetical protein
VRVAVHKTGHYHTPGGIDLLRTAGLREVLDTPREAHFEDAPVPDQEGAVANDF